MNKKEQLNQAFSQIDDRLIEQAANVPKNKKTLLRKWGSLAVAVSILICISIGVFHTIHHMNSPDIPPIDINPSVVSKNGWKTVYSDESSLKKTKTGSNEFQYTLCIDYAPVETLYENVLSISPREDALAEMFGQWMISQLAFDYQQHFLLFSEAFLNNTVYRDFENAGLTAEQANQKIAQVAADVIGFTDYRVEYTILDIKNTPELLQQYKDEYKTLFQEADLDIDTVEEVCEYTFEEVNIYFNEIFLNRTYVSNIVFYKYNGEWYISPEMLEDDLCIDLVLSEKGSNRGYYRSRYISGQVQNIENGYAVLGSENYFLIKDDDIAVGDYVEITYYSVGLEAVRVSDGESCHIGVIAEVKKTDDM